ncbi:MAG: acyl-CoA dehydrogenase [Marinilabiliales bacterium]|nr:MAG: acyl-CoA dehydrogenase [Marinilabiliales bacterium]
MRVPEITSKNRNPGDNHLTHVSGIPFEEFLGNFKAKMKNVFHLRSDVNRLALNRGMPPFMMREILSANPLATEIPAEYGGRGGKIEENLAVLSAASYESLALSLTLGINMALFLQPVAKYAREEVKAPVFERFLNQQNMGGLMITEPGYGSDALNMQTSYTGKNDRFHLQGIKHWAGLTGWADYWLLTARERTAGDDLKRDIDFFICDVNGPDQQIIVEEFYENLGLYQIPYGRNRLDVKIPEIQRLVPHTTGVKMMLDLLHRSRMQFPGMGLGFVQRMLDESIAHARQRQIGRSKLLAYDQVQHRLARMQASYTLLSAMCASSGSRAGRENDLSQEGFEANSIKTVVTDLMQEAAQSATQLVGAQAYKLNHIAGRGIIDSRPFQIFEGSNDILYAQISENLIKMMKKTRESNLYRFLKSFSLTSRSAPLLKTLLDFRLDTAMPQRKLVELGQVLARVVSSEMVINLREKGFRTDLIENGLDMLKHEITALTGSFAYGNRSVLIEDYHENSSWLKSGT